jgi:peroxiredoxin
MDTILVVSSILLWVVLLLNLLLTLRLSRRLRSLFPEMEPLRVGQQAPDFSASSLHGKTVTLADYEGQATALIFVSPDCPPCREALPKVQDLWPSAREVGTELVLVSNADEETTRSIVDGLAADLTILVAHQENNPFFFDYKVMGTPSVCMIDAKGKVQVTGMRLFELEEKLGSFHQAVKGGDRLVGS